MRRLPQIADGPRQGWLTTLLVVVILTLLGLGYESTISQINRHIDLGGHPGMDSRVTKLETEHQVKQAKIVKLEAELDILRQELRNKACLCVPGE